MSTRPKRDKFADADKAFDKGAFPDAGPASPGMQGERAAQPKTTKRDLSPNNDRGLAGRVGYSVYRRDLEAADSIRHRLYMQGVRLNSSEVVRFAIAVLNSHSDSELLALHAVHGPLLKGR